MSSSNPIMKSVVGSQSTNYYGGYQQQGYDPYGGSAPIQSERPMTVDDVITSTGITLGVIIAFAAVNFGIGTFSPSLMMVLTIVGMIGGLVTVLISAFGKKFGSKVLTLSYAAFEGLFVGGFSLLVSGFGITVAKQDAGLMIGQAVLGTIGVFIGMLYVYKTGAVKVTPRFTRILTGALIGVLVLALGNMVMAMFGVGNVLRDGGPIAIIFSLVCIVLAALSFLQDFDLADRLVRSGAPARYSWGVALGLAVTLVWLYTEILRLLSYFQSR